MFINDRINGTSYFYKKRDGTNRSFNVRVFKFHVSKRKI